MKSENMEISIYFRKIGQLARVTAAVSPVRVMCLHPPGQVGARRLFSARDNLINKQVTH